MLRFLHFLCDRLFLMLVCRLSMFAGSHCGWWTHVHFDFWWRHQLFRSFRFFWIHICSFHTHSSNRFWHIDAWELLLDMQENMPWISLWRRHKNVNERLRTCWREYSPVYVCGAETKRIKTALTQCLTRELSENKMLLIKCCVKKRDKWSHRWANAISHHTSVRFTSESRTERRFLDELV